MQLNKSLIKWLNILFDKLFLQFNIIMSESVNVLNVNENDIPKTKADLSQFIQYVIPRNKIYLQQTNKQGVCFKDLSAYNDTVYAVNNNVVKPAKYIYMFMTFVTIFEIFTIIPPFIIMKISKEYQCDLGDHFFKCYHYMSVFLVMVTCATANIILIMRINVDNYWKIKKTSPSPWTKLPILAIILTILMLYESKEYSIGTLLGFSGFIFLIYILPALNSNVIPSIICPLLLILFYLFIINKYISLNNNHSERVISLLITQLCVMMSPFLILISEKIGPFRKQFCHIKEYMYLIIEILFVICIQIPIFYNCPIHM